MKIIDYKNFDLDLKGSIMLNGENDYIAVTASVSKSFRTLNGARKFMEKKGYRGFLGMKYSLMKKDEQGTREIGGYKNRKAVSASYCRMKRITMHSEFVTIGETGINYFFAVSRFFPGNIIAKYYIKQNY